MSEPLILSHETQAAADLIAALRSNDAFEDDVQLMHDMVEGSTNFREAVLATMEYIERLEDDVLAADARKKQLEARKADREGRIERLKATLLRALTQVPELVPFREPGRYTISIAKKPAQVAVDVEPADLHPWFKRVTIEPNKAELKKALQSGMTIDGVRLVDGGTHLVIRRG